jgi:protease PrsW
MDALILVIIAIIPPLAFLLYIHHLDSIEPEPHGLILKALVLGGLAVIPAAIIEIALGKALAILPVPAMGELVAAAVSSFVVIAPIEEALKLGVVLLFIWKKPDFNEENDGIVYVGAAAIGFSLVENIFYVMQSGLATGIMRAVTSIPLHTFTGVIMGYFVGIAKFSPDSKNRKILLGFIVAYVIHALYDAFVLSGTGVALLVIPLVIALLIFGVVYLKKGARLSSRRWNNAAPGAPQPEAPPTETAPQPAKPAVTGSGTYKVVISRVIFALSALFWALLIIGAYVPSGHEAANPADVMIGGILLTIIPVAIGVVLELSHRRQKKNAAAAA